MKKIYKQLGIIFVMAFAIMIGCFSNVFAAGTVWNPDDKNVTYILSNNNLTVSTNGASGGIGGIRTNKFKTQGKYYWEIKAESIDAGYAMYAMIGIASDTLDIQKDDTVSGSREHSCTLYGANGCIYPNMQSYGKGFTTNDIIGIALDIDNHKINFYENGKDQGSISIPAYAKYYPFVSSGASGSRLILTANFGATSFNYKVPDGYNPYDASGLSIVSTSISLNKTTDTLQIGQADQLTTTITPDTVTNKTVTWKSSDESIATVDSTGKVTAVKEGTANITATTTDGSNLSASCTLTATSQTPPVTQGIVLNIEPEKNKIKLNETVSANLTIDNIKDIAAEDVRIKYDSSKLQFLGAAEVDGIKLVKNDAKDGELRIILASKGVTNVVEAKKALLKLNFKGIAAGDALVGVTKGRVSDGIEMEKDLTDDQCGQNTITIDNEALTDVNKDGQFTLLDLAIDSRHYSEDPAALTQYNTDIVVNKAIDDDDLTKIGEYMLANPNYKF